MKAIYLLLAALNTLAPSPENTFLYTNEKGEQVPGEFSSGCSFDQFMILQVFEDYVEAAAVLAKSDKAYVQQIKGLIPRIYQPKIGEDGRLMEWRFPFGEKDPGHRHISHVIGAYPGNQINLDEDTEMRSAVLETLKHRLRNGGAHTDWSRAWTIGMMARLSDAERAYENLHAILVKSTLDNLLDTHPPFQIDGNFGATAAVAEMLIHSHNDEIKLLPTDRWPDGYVKGQRARGDYTVDIEWADGKLKNVTVLAGDHVSGPVRIAYDGSSKAQELASGQSIRLVSSDF